MPKVGHSSSTLKLPYPRNHSLPRTYLLYTEFLGIPLLRSYGGHSKVRRNKDSTANQCPVHYSARGCCQKGQQCIDGNLTRVVRTQQVRKERMRRQLVVPVLGAQTVEVVMVGMLERMGRENRWY